MFALFQSISACIKALFLLFPSIDLGTLEQWSKWEDEHLKKRGIKEHGNELRYVGNADVVGWDSGQPWTVGTRRLTQPTLTPRIC